MRHHIDIGSSLPEDTPNSEARAIFENARDAHESKARVEEEVLAKIDSIIERAKTEEIEILGEDQSRQLFELKDRQRKELSEFEETELYGSGYSDRVEELRREHRGQGNEFISSLDGDAKEKIASVREDVKNRVNELFFR